MKLILNEQFELELDNNVILKGTLKTITKKEQKSLEAKFKRDRDLAKSLQKLSKQAKRLDIEIKYEEDPKKIKVLQNKIFKLEDEVEKITEELETLETKESVAKMRFDLCVESDQLEELIEICEQYSYEVVMRTIFKDIEEKKQKKAQS